jgi:hypothetical protein
MFLETRSSDSLFDIFNNSSVEPQFVKDQVFGRKTSPLHCPKVKTLGEILLHLEEQQGNNTEESKKRLKT